MDILTLDDKQQMGKEKFILLVKTFANPQMFFSEYNNCIPTDLKLNTIFIKTNIGNHLKGL